MENYTHLSEYFFQALKSIQANRLRSFLSMLGVIIGVMAVIVIISTGEGTKQKTLDQIEKLGTRNIYVRDIPLSEKGNHNFQLNFQDYKNVVDQCNGIVDSACVKEISIPVIGSETDINPLILAVSPGYMTVLDLPLVEGRQLLPMDKTESKLVCVIGKRVAYGLGNQGHIGGKLRLGSHLFSIVGIIDRDSGEFDRPSTISTRNYSELILIPLGVEAWLSSYLMTGWEMDSRLSEMIFTVESESSVGRTSVRIKDIMDQTHKNNKGYQIVAPLELLNQAMKARETFSLFLVALASVSLAVGGIGIMNIMLATVSERTQEIGIRRAVGAQKKHILFQFLSETIVLTFIGGIVGIIMGASCLWILEASGGAESIITTKAILLPQFVSLATGILAGIYPAYQAARFDPIQALSV